jgi:hypothetical protein
METLRTPEAVIEALGGTNAVALLTGRAKSAVSMWKARGRFPTDTYIILTKALRRKKKTAPIALWGMKCASHKECA